jgi:two-component system cell cycle sensor histidine kinase/response regulator CckA
VSAPASRCSILIVEDEPIVAKDLQQTLQEMKYDAFAIASNADDAIKRATERCPDLVLMDIRIKGKRDGIETAEIFRQQFGISVIYLTAHADEATIARATRTAPYGYLLKPIKSAELRSAIEVALYKQGLEKCARERERSFSVALNSVSDAVVAVDLAGKVTYLNPAAESLIGSRAGDAVGKGAEEILHLMDRSSAVVDPTPLDAALRLKQPVEPDQASLKNLSTGKQHTINECAAPVLDAGQLLGAVMVFRDVGEKRKMQQQLELADRLASLGTMAAGTAHELNNPLTVVVTNAGFLAEELAQLQADVRASSLREMTEKRFARLLEALGDLQASASRMGRIVADLRGFARPAAVVSQSVDLRRAIEWAIRATAHELQHRAQLRTRFDAAPPIAGDSARVEQVLVNLLVNAAHAIAPGRAERNEVFVSLCSDDRGRAVIEVRDTGDGIHPDVIEKIFEPFFTTKKAGVGTGLGLSISHGIVKSLGGEILVTSEPGGGTTFTILLPPAPTLVHAEANQVALPEPVALRGRILIIDDESALLRAMQRILEDEDHDVVATDSALDALAMIERGDRFDVILSDLMMPTMTGLEFYETLLARNPQLAKSVVFVSGGAVTAKVDTFLRSISNLQMEKPFKAAQLRDMVQRVLRQSLKPADAGTTSLAQR